MAYINCVALIFSLSSVSDRHRDRLTEACTDQECKWDKPKKTSMPIEIDDIDLRTDQSSDDSEKVYSLMKDSNPILLHTLDPPSDDSDIDNANEYNVPTLKDVIPQ